MPRKSKSVQDNLTPRQIAFAINYAGSGNATDAAKRAGYSEKSAAVQGCLLLKLPKVAALVEEERAARWKRMQMSGDEVLARLATIARPDIRKVFGPKGEILSPDQYDDETAMQVASFEARLEFSDDGAPPEEIRKIKLRDPTPALRILAQHHKLVGGEVNVMIGEDLADRLANARKRAAKEGAPA